MTTGEKIKELRSMLKLTHEGLGKLVNVSKQTVSLWEKDKKNPSKENLKKLDDVAESYRISLAFSDSNEVEYRECNKCQYKSIEPTFSYCPKCGTELFKINMHECQNILLSFYMIDKLIARAEEKAMYPYIDLEAPRKGNPEKSDNKEESRAIKYAESADEIRRLQKIKAKVPLVLDSLPGLEKEVIELMYQSHDNLRKSYHLVSKITGLEYIFVKDTDEKVKKLVANYFVY